MLEILILVVLVVFCYLLGKVELGALKLSFVGLSEQLLLSTSLGLGSLALFMLGLGLAGLYYRWLVVPVLIVAMIMLVYFNGRQECLSIVDELKRKSFKLPTLLLLIVLLGLAYSLIKLLQCATPVMEHDSLVAYLHVPKLYVEHHGIYSIRWMNWDDLPLNIQMLNGLGILLYSEILAQLISGWLMGILCSLAVYVIARKFVNRSIALVSAIIFYTMPTLSWIFYSTKIDLGYAMFELCFWALFVRWFYEKDKKLLYISAIFLGLAIGSKYHALFALVFAVPVLFISLIKTQERFTKIVLIIFTFCIIALAIGCPAYIKNYAYTGDPFCPFISEQDTGSLENCNQYSGLLDYVRFQYNMVFEKDYFVTPTFFSGHAMGYLIIVFLPFLVFYKLVEKRHRALILIFTAYYLFLSFIIFKSAYPFVRHFLPAIGLLAVINAYGLKVSIQCVSNKITYSYALLGLVCMVVFVNVGFGPASYSRIKIQVQYLTGSVTKTDYMKHILPSYYQNMNDEMVAHTKNMEVDALIMALDRKLNYFADRPLIRNDYFYTIRDYDSLIARLREEGFTHVYFSKPMMDRFVFNTLNRTYSPILEGISKGSLILELQAGDQYLYRIFYD